MLAPSINIKQACSPDRLPGTAPIGIRVTGLALCMKNTASDALLAVSGAVAPAFQLWNGPFSLTWEPYHTEGLDTLLRTLRFVRSITTLGEDYGLIILASGDVRHTRCIHLSQFEFPLSQ
jgi:hypothetical protein